MTHEPANIPALEARHLTLGRGGTTIVNDINLAFAERTITAIIGRSGCGKSTFLRALNRIHEVEPDAEVTGQVLLRGEDVYAPGSDVQRVRRRIGMVFQQPTVFNMTVGENVAAAWTCIGAEPPNDPEYYLDLVDLPARADQDATDLSGGQAQRLAIARTLAAQPEVLLLDEPCSALDSESATVIEHLLLKLADSLTIVIVTHDLEQARRLADRAAFFSAAGGIGALIEAGPHVLTSPQREETALFLRSGGEASPAHEARA
ncbi:MAG: ATP-binding cassette domain-containing protein [Flaviflexus sp.]|nr:ATP-binding cassette domain-containing protein [Flaviflexus sp.]